MAMGFPANDMSVVAHQVFLARTERIALGPETWEQWLAEARAAAARQEGARPSGAANF